MPHPCPALFCGQGGDFDFLFLTFQSFTDTMVPYTVGIPDDLLIYCSAAFNPLQLSHTEI